MIDDELFERVVNPDEIILWSDRPHFIAYMMKVRSGLIFGMVWALLDTSEIITTIQLNGFWYSDYAVLFLRYGPLIYALLKAFVHMIEFRNVNYAFTDRKVIITRGVFVLKYDLLEYTRLYNIQVDENPIERMLGIGTIKIPTASRTTVRINNQIQVKYAKLIGIEHPFETFKALKLIEEDVKDSEGMPNIDLPGMKELFDMSPDILRNIKKYMED